MTDKTKLYLDACIFVAYFYDKHPNHLEIRKCVEGLRETFDFDIYASYWSVNEMIKVLIREYGYRRQDADKIAKIVFDTSSLGNLRFKWVEPDSGSEYTFREFFDHLTTHLIESKEIHLADAFHSVIMMNNNIEHILTTNGDDFKGLGTFTPIEPKVFNVILDNS